MSTSKLKFIALYSTLLVGMTIQSTHANQDYICTHGQDEREVSLVYFSNESIPCEVRYKNKGETKVLWSSKNTEGFCEEKTQAFIRKQINWDWFCEDMSASTIISNEPRNSLFDIYIQSGAFEEAAPKM